MQTYIQGKVSKHEKQMKNLIFFNQAGVPLSSYLSVFCTSGRVLFRTRSIKYDFIVLNHSPVD
jgi:hypothetical protein